MTLKPSLSNKGLTLIELLVAMALLGILSLLVLQSLTGSLRVKRREDVRIEVQQNLRAAAQIIAEDVRSAAFMRLWNGDCSKGACSNHKRVSLVVLDGTFTRVPEPPGNSFTNSVTTRVCDARLFKAGDQALLVNGQQVELLVISKVIPQPGHNYSAPCTGPNNPPPNSDKIQHTDQKISGQWNQNATLYRAHVVNYFASTDADGEGVLCRVEGLTFDPNKPCEDIGTIVAFDVFDIDGDSEPVTFDYGLPENPNALGSKLRFYPDLVQAANSLSNYTSDPLDNTATYIGGTIKALLITLEGGKKDMSAANYKLTQIAEFRR